jgi:hypothetical protein
MKWLPVLCYLGIAAWQIGPNFGLHFPRDAAKRDVLRECFAENHTFDALDQDARARCLAARSHAAMLQPPPPRAPNFVDLRRAQSQGPTRGNDIRNQAMIR